MIEWPLFQEKNLERVIYIFIYIGYILIDADKGQVFIGIADHIIFLSLCVHVRSVDNWEAFKRFI